MARILKDAGFSAADLLPLKDFKFLFDKSDFKINEKKMQRVISVCEEKILPSEFPVITLSSCRDFVKTGNRGEFQRRYFIRRGELMMLLFGEMYKREGRYVERIADTVWAILEESTWPISAHLAAYPETRDVVPNVFGDNATMHNIDLFAAATGAILALVYTYLKDELDAISPTICKKIRWAVRERIIKPYLNRYFDWMGIYNPTHSNWCIWITSNIITVAPVFSENDGEYRRIMERAMYSLDTYIDSNNPDGGCEEGPRYWSHAVGSYFDSLQLLYDMSGGKINVFGNEYIKKLGEYIVNFNITDNMYLNFGDAGHELKHDSWIIREYGDACHSDVMSSFGTKLDFLRGDNVDGDHPYRSLRNMTSPIIDTPPDCIANTSVYYDSLKIMIARESEKSNQGFFLGVKGGHNGELHGHRDIGCFVVHYNGEAVIIDPGVGKYMNWRFRNRENHWQIDSDFHNVPIINGCIQSEGKEYRSENEVYDNKSLTLEITKAYPEDAGLERFVRRSEINDGIIITDDITLKREGEIDFIFMTVGEPRLEDGKILLDAGRVMYYPEGLDASVEKVDTTLSCVSHRTNPDPVLHRIHLKAKTACGKFIFTIK